MRKEGGGMKSGVVYGERDEFGYKIIENAVDMNLSSMNSEVHCSVRQTFSSQPSYNCKYDIIFAMAIFCIRLRLFLSLYLYSW